MFAMVLGATIPDNSFIAIDDISLSIGSCESPIGCNFDEDFCSWTNSKKSTANWIRFTGMTKIVKKWLSITFYLNKKKFRNTEIF